MPDLRSWLPHRRSDPAVYWETLARTALIAVFILVPIIVLPVTGDRWDFHKGFILLAGVTIAWLGYFSTVLVRRHSSWQWHRLDLPVLALVGVALLSTLFSVDRWASVTGFLGNVPESVPVILALASLYFLTSELFRERRIQWVVFAGLGAGIGLALLIQIFQLSRFSVIPFNVSDEQLFSVISNNPFDTPLVAALFALAMFYCLHRAREQWFRLLLTAGVALALIIMFFFGQPLAWAVFAVGMVGLVLLESKLGHPASIRRIVLAVIVAGLGMVIQFSDLPAQSGVPRPVDIRLGHDTSYQIAGSTFARRPILGSGGATWFHNFVQYRPTEFNNSPFWTDRFVKARSNWSQIVADLGLLGLAAWGAIFGLAAWGVWRIWKQQTNAWTTLALTIVALTFILGFFVAWSLVWLVIFWTTLGLLRLWGGAEAKTRPIGLGTPFGFAALVLVAVSLWYPAIKYYMSEVLIEQSRVGIGQTESLDTVIARLERAVSLNPHSLDGLLLLAQGYQADGELNMLDGKTDATTTRFEQAIAAGREAIAQHQRNPVPYEVFNNLLNRMASQVAGAADEAGKNFERLRAIEPSSPVHDVGFGQILLLKRDEVLAGGPAEDEGIKKQAQQYLTAALSAFEAALKKKPDYLQARFARAQGRSAGGDYQAALDDLTALGTAAQDVPLYWNQLGLVLSKLDNDADAVRAFDRSLELDPKNPSTFVAYSQHFKDAGDMAKAKDILEQGLVRIPNDPQLTAALQAL